MDLVLDSFMKVKIPQGSVHRQAKELFNAVSVAKWRLRMTGADYELFSEKVVISALISTMEEGMQARYFLQITRDPQKCKKVA